MPLYPTEAVLFDENQVPTVHYTGTCRPMHKWPGMKQGACNRVCCAPARSKGAKLPCRRVAGEGVLALPKLNLQFLTFADYLLRNFNLFRLEATYEIREDIADILKRVGPYLSDDERVRSHARSPCLLG